MSDQRNRYEVKLGGITHTMLLNERDAKRYNAKPAPNRAVKAAAKPRNKAAEAPADK